MIEDHISILPQLSEPSPPCPKGTDKGTDTPPSALLPRKRSHQKHGHSAVAQPHEGTTERSRVANCEWKSTTTHHAPGYWDQLLNISLTHRALSEFNCRATLKEKKAVFPASTPQDLDGFPHHLKQDLKRFARFGGPDLSDIVGVTHQSSSPFSDAPY